MTAMGHRLSGIHVGLGDDEHRRQVTKPLDPIH